MADTTIPMKDAGLAARLRRVLDEGALGLSPINAEHPAQRAALLAAFSPLASDAKLEAVRAALSVIAGDTSPVPTTTNLVSGNGAYISLGSPSVTASNLSGWSNAFIANGEIVRFRCALYTTGDRTWNALTSGAYVWLETDLTGGTGYLPILGSKQMLADATPAIGSGFVPVFSRVPVGANCRLGMNFGTMGGSTGTVGINTSVRN